MPHRGPPSVGHTQTRYGEFGLPHQVPKPKPKHTSTGQPSEGIAGGLPYRPTFPGGSGGGGGGGGGYRPPPPALPPAPVAPAPPPAPGPGQQPFFFEPWSFPPGSGSSGPSFPARGSQTPNIPAVPVHDPLNSRNALEAAQAHFPWLPRHYIDLILEAQKDNPEVTDVVLISLIRQDPQHARDFPSIRRSDGTLRMNEQVYMRQLDAYREIETRFGRDPNKFGVVEMGQLLEYEVGVDEYSERLTLYNEVKRSGRDIRDAFYVYAGLKLSDDDMYEYVTDTDRRAQLDADYNRRATLNPLDYDTFITRSTEAALDRAAGALEDLYGTGLDTSSAMASLRSINPQYARHLTDILFQGSDGTPLASLVDLQHTLQAALVASAASVQGFTLPTRDRVEAFRRAGVDRSRALEGYSLFARQGANFAGQVERLNQDTGEFGLEQFENAVFLQGASEQELLTRAASREQSFGRSQGGAALQQSGNRLLQPGLQGVH